MECKNDILYVFSGLLTSGIVTYFSIPSIIRVARIKSLYDFPNERKSHNRRIPTLGGLAIFAGFVLALTIWGNSIEMKEMQYIIAAVTVMFFIGIKDDILVTAPLTKIVGQITACLIPIFFGDVRLTNFHGFFGFEEVSYFVSISASLLVMLAIVNGFNLIDGIDGLASGVGITTAFTFAFWFFSIGEMQYSVLAVSIAGALMAFFRFNVFGRKNKIFMGDTGALVLGLIISVLAIEFNEYNIDKFQKHAIIPAPAVTFGILIVPLFDIIRVVFIRIVKNKGRGVFSPDQNHIHHHMLNLGLSHPQATFIIVSINIFYIILSFELAKYMSVRRMLLLLILISMIIFHIPVFIRELKNKKRK